MVLLVSVMFFELMMYVAPFVSVWMILFSAMWMFCVWFIIMPVLKPWIVKPLRVMLSAVIWMAICVHVPLRMVLFMPAPISVIVLFMTSCSL